jgi:hypothetical protein
VEKLFIEEIGGTVARYDVAERLNQLRGVLRREDGFGMNVYSWMVNRCEYPNPQLARALSDLPSIGACRRRCRVKVTGFRTV